MSEEGFASCDEGVEFAEVPVRVGSLSITARHSSSVPAARARVPAAACPASPAAPPEASSSGSLPAPSTHRHHGAFSAAPGLPAAPPELPPELRDLAARLTAGVGPLSPRARVWRAFALGRAAGRKLRGESRVQARHGALGLRNSHYAVLRGRDASVAPGIRTSYEAYREAVGRPFAAESVSGAFPSWPEARAFGLGAGVAL